MYVKPVYLRRRRTRTALLKAERPEWRRPVEVSPETPRRIGFNPTATAAPITIAR